jgi:hypothetical protein
MGHQNGPEPEPEPVPEFTGRQDAPAPEPADYQEKPAFEPADHQYTPEPEPVADRQDEPEFSPAPSFDIDIGRPAFDPAAIEPAAAAASMAAGNAVPDSAAATAWDTLGADGIISARCPACGAGFYGGRKMARAVCPRCGGAKVVEEPPAGALKPDYIIPFKCGKDDAVRALDEFCSDKVLLPDSFVAMNKITGAREVYVPFWLFDAETSAHVEYSAYIVIPGGKYSSTKYDHYSITRKAAAVFKNVPVDASQKMDDTYMDAIRPYNFSEMVDFRPQHLAERLAVAPDVGAAESVRRFENMVKVTFSDNFDVTSEYQGVEETVAEYDIKRGAESCALLPVWVLDTQYEGIDYTFMVNGQNGRVAGRLPMSRVKAWKHRALHIGAWWALFAPAFYIFVRFFDIYTPAVVPVMFALAVAAVAGLFTSAPSVKVWEEDMDNTMMDAGAFDSLVPGSFANSEKEDTYLGRTYSSVFQQEEDNVFRRFLQSSD